MGTRLQLAVTVSEQRNDKGEITSPASDYPSQLEWTDHMVSYDDSAGRRIVLDFANRLHREIDERARTVVVKPLQAVVSFRDLEVRNREHIHSVLKAGGVADNDFSPILSEHHLSVSLHRSQRTLGKRSVIAKLTGGPDIVVVEQKSQTDMMVGAKCLMSVSRDDHGPPEAVAAFTHFLRHAFGGHPRLLQEILDARRLPASVTLGHLMPMHTGGEVTIRVEGTSGASRTPSTEQFEERLLLDGSEPIDAVLRSSGVPPSPTPVAARSAEALSLLQGSSPLVGLLTFFEIVLEQPVEMPPEIAAAVNASTDKAVANFFALLQSPPSEADARARLRVFEALRDRAGRLAYLLGAFEATLHRTLKQRVEAVAVLTKLLETNPRVTGAWKDLGDLFSSTYDFTRAWLCWQRARAIAPAHPVLNDITAYEQRLEADHPAYFSLS